MAFYPHRPSPSPRSRALSPTIRFVLLSFLLQKTLPLGDVLTETEIRDALAQEHVTFAEGEANAVYTPAVVLWAFLSQALFKGEQRSCLAAVARIRALLSALGLPSPALNNGRYCRARAQLPESLFTRLIRQIADGCEARLPAGQLWQARHVKFVDGTTLSMPDTQANQVVYPQQSQQQPGLGFPLMRLVVLLSLATGMVCGTAGGPYKGKETGETALFRELLDRLDAGDVLVADCYFCSYFMVALLQERGVDFVTRIHQCRDYDFRRGEPLGKGDHVVEWVRPQRPSWMDHATYERMPESIRVRELKVEVDEPGFRVESLVVVTTLRDGQQYPPEEIAALYRKRWLAELDLEAIKIALGMDVLRAKSPKMVRQEMGSCLLAYNLIRKLILQSALPEGRSMRTMSFTTALQTIAASYVQIATASPAQSTRLIEAAAAGLPAAPPVGHRPHRVEPRAIKRRPKPHDLLTKPRDEARAALLKRHQRKPLRHGRILEEDAARQYKT
jgi:putative transposase